MFRKKILFVLGVLQLCLFKYCHNVQPIPQIDAIGYLTKMLTTFLNNVLHPVLPGVDDSFYCSVETLYAHEKTGPKYIELVGTELKLSLRPRGTCRYCCVLKNPRNYMSIYFVSKPKNNTIKLKIIKKKGYLKSKGFNSNIDTIMYIHGFSEHGLGVSAKGVRDAYLSKEKDYNIMLLDWAHLSVFPWYTEAVENSKIVGNILGDFVRFYSNTGELFVDKLHLIGFSLGSHIAGSVGKLLKKEKLSRITALDPAFPQFSLTDTTQRLSTSDAKYVDVIHTDGGIFGFPTSLGHADFYPNGGQQVQPGCEPSQLAENGDLISIVLCNHFRSWKFYVESVNNSTSFPATHCGIMENGTWTRCNFTTHNYMGYSVNKSALGNFYLSTYDKHPFSKTASEQFFAQDQLQLIL